MSAWIRRCALAAFSALSAVMLVEFFARWYVEGGLAPALGSLIGRRVQAQENAGDSWFVPDPVLGFALNPGQPGICSRGYRGDEPEAGRQPGRRRLLVLGDSISYDVGSWAELLPARLVARNGEPLELINASVPGYTTHQERSYFERRLAYLEPDLVVLQYCLNDNHRMLHQLGPDGHRLFTPEARRAMVAGDGGALDLLCRYSYAAVELRERWLQRGLAVDRLQPWDRLEGFRTAWQAGSWADFARELEGLRDAVHARGGRLVVVAFPLESQLVARPPEIDADWVRLPQRSLVEACARLDVSALDLFDAFEQETHGNEPFFRDGLHLSPAGHALAAERVAAFLAP